MKTSPLEPILKQLVEKGRINPSDLTALANHLVYSGGGPPIPTTAGSPYQIIKILGTSPGEVTISKTDLQNLLLITLALGADGAGREMIEKIFGQYLRQTT